MTLYNINVASKINVTFVTYYKIFNCNIYNNTVGKFICIQSILSMAIKGRRKNFSYYFVPLLLFQIISFSTLLSTKKEVEFIIPSDMFRLNRTLNNRVIAQAVVVAVGTDVDTVLGILGTVC